MALIDISPLQSAAASRVPINTNPVPSGDCIGINCDNTTSLGRLYYNGLVTLLYAASIIAVLTFIYAGISYVTAGGEADKVEKAKKMIIGSIIGMLIIASAFIVFRTSVNVVKAPSGADMNEVLNQQ